jgi:hypothetical protein
MTYALDFDGVIHGYRLGWHDGTIYDEPVDGALEGVRTVLGWGPAYVHTSRAPEPVAAWLNRYSLPATASDLCPDCPPPAYEPMPDCRCCQGTGRVMFWNTPGVLLVTNLKLPATHYLDDRAVRFYEWGSALAALAPLGGRR